MLRCASYLVTAAYPKYASFLGIRAPCLRPFYEVICKLLILRLFTSLSLFYQKIAGFKHTTGGWRIGMFGKQRNSIAYLLEENVALTYPADILILPQRKQEY